MLDFLVFVPSSGSMVLLLPHTPPHQTVDFVKKNHPLSLPPSARNVPALQRHHGLSLRISGKDYHSERRWWRGVSIDGCKCLLTCPAGALRAAQTEPWPEGSPTAGAAQCFVESISRVIWVFWFGYFLSASGCEGSSQYIFVLLELCD